LIAVVILASLPGCIELLTMSLFIETGHEENANRRARQGKIKGKHDKGYGVPPSAPGYLDLKVSYENGSLHVKLGKANLNAKWSQDPYACVYLLDESRICYFEKGHNKTRTFEKNKEPDFDSEPEFKFQMSISDVAKKNLVIAIWDEDSKNNDDYMAGITLSMKDVLFFREKSKNVMLKHQDVNGHPAEASSKEIFGIAFIEERIETNAQGRADKGKIQTLSKYAGVKPGTLNIEMDYVDGCLRVHLGSAKDLAGKRSQDPYAFVYLLGNNRMSYFQVGNNRTKKFEKNLNPHFNQDFQFKMNMTEITSKSLVVAIWDDDSNSKDDYMAGFRVSMKEFQNFQNRSVLLNLLQQDLDGHPVEVSARSIFGIKTSNWDLKTCNNKLVSFIDRARVLSEAYEIKGSLPSILQESTTMLPPDAGKLFDFEIQKLRGMMNGTRSNLMSTKITLDKLKTENHHMKESYQNFQYTLQERQQTMHTLEIRESELATKCSGSDYLMEQIRMLEMRIKTERGRITSGRITYPEKGEDLRISEAHFHESTLNMPSVGGISSGSNMRDSERREFYVKTRTEYSAKMRAALNKAREQYRKNYEIFIMKIERDADEIMNLYDEIIKERSSKSSLRKSGLLDIERSRAYELRINQLRADIRDIDMKIGNVEGKLGGLDSNYKDLLGHLDVDLNGLKAKLRALFVQFTEFTKTRYSEVNEVSIYGQLLDYEEHRIRENRPVRKVTVSENVMRASQKTSMSIGGNVSSSYGHENSVKEAPKRRESGYSSPGKTPEGTLEHGIQLHDFEQVAGGYGESGFSNSTRTTVESRNSRSSTGSLGGASRSTRSSAGTSYVGRTSAMFDNIMGDVMQDSEV